MSPSIKAHLALFVVALIYGANYTIAKDVLNSESIGPHGFILFRILTGLILFGLLYRLRTPEKIAKEDWKLLVLCGLFGAALNQIFFFRGLKLTGPIHASLIMTTTPILVLLISSVMLKEKITPQKILGIFIGASGAVMLIAYGQEVHFDSNSLWGDLQVLINATSFAIYLVLVKSLMAKYHPFTIMFWLFLFGFCFVFPVSVQEVLAIQWSSFTVNIWMGFAYVMICTTFLTYLLNAYALKRLRASVVSAYIYLQPLIASSIALLLGKDVGTVLKLIAAVLIFMGVYLVSDFSIRRKA